MVMAGGHQNRLAAAPSRAEASEWSEGRAGEVDWEYLYQRYADPLRRLIARRLPYDGPVEDVLQETYARGIRSTRHIDTSRPPWPFLATVAGRAVADWWAREGSRRAVTRPPDEGLVEQPADDFPGSDDHAGTIDRVVRVRRALLALTPRHRRALYLYEGADCSYETLVELDRTTPKAMKSLLGRARARFQEQCERPALSLLVWHRTLPARLRHRVERLGLVSVTAEGLTALSGAVVAALVSGVTTVPLASATASTVRAEVDPVHVEARGEANVPPSSSPEAAERPAEPPTAPPAALGPSGGAGRGGREPSPLGRPPPSVHGGGGLVNTREETTASFWVTVAVPAAASETTLGMTTRCEQGDVAARKCEVLRLVPGST